MSSLAGGTGDFIGGTASRRLGVMWFLLCTQLIGLVIAGVWIAASAAPAPSIKVIAAAAGAGVGLTVGIAAFFRAMVVGAISIAAPISATGVLLPVLVGIAGGERLTSAHVAGMIAGIGGTLVVSRPPSSSPSSARERGVGLACLSAVGNGLWLTLMAPASRHAVSWTMLVLSATAVCIVGPALVIRHTSMLRMLTLRSATAILSAGVLTFVAVVLYAYATRHGQLAVVSVLASLYPVVTVLLALVVLGERIHGTHRLGVVAVLTGVILLSA